MSDYLDQNPSYGAWIEKSFAAKNISGAMRSEDVVQTPYSIVIRLYRSEQIYYFKKAPVNLFIEARILELLRAIYPDAHIPSIIASNKELSCFIMGSCGDITLRTHFSGTLKADLLIKGVETYKDIQRASAKQGDMFLQAGVLDWRLPRLVELYRDFSHQDKQLQAWGLTAKECHQLRQAQNFFEGLCKDLDAYQLPDALNHADFQDNNIVIDKATKQISVIDWGEVSMGHPLLHIIGCFKKACRRYHLSKADPAYTHLKQQFLSGWVDQADVNRVYDCAALIDDIYYALTLVDLMKQVENVNPDWGARIRMACLSFIEQAQA